MFAIYLAAAILCLVLAHLLRVLRWSYSIKIYEKPEPSNLMAALAGGSILSLFLPFKLGELFRIWYAGKRLKNSYAFSFATVVLDRYLDFICVGLFFIGFSIIRPSEDVRRAALFYIAVMGCLVLLTVLLFAGSGFVKLFSRRFAALFNQNIEYQILKTVWSGISSFKDFFYKIPRIKMLGVTVCMWGLYISSYSFFAYSISEREADCDFLQTFCMLFTADGLLYNKATLPTGSSVQWMLAIYMLAALCLILVLSIVLHFLHGRKCDPTQTDAPESYLNLIPQFSREDRLTFLEAYFDNKQRAYLSKYLELNRGITILRDYSAGSNSTTILCLDRENTFFRKYAFGEDAAKLQKQLAWIQDHPDLSLTGVLTSRIEEDMCCYDMPFEQDAKNFFEYIHIVDVKKSWGILARILDHLQEKLYSAGERRISSEDTIAQYIREKAEKNLATIQAHKLISSFKQYDTLIINGKAYHNLSFYEEMLSPVHLKQVFRQDVISDIHGDLTIENMIASSEREGGFYLIDPNPGNIHDATALDYAKILQSLHGNYEFLRSVRDVNLQDNRIEFPLTVSHAYHELYLAYRAWLHEQFDEITVRSIFYHELVHWMRLMPYKLRKGGRVESIVFYAGFLMILEDVYNEFEVCSR